MWRAKHFNLYLRYRDCVKSDLNGAQTVAATATAAAAKHEVDVHQRCFGKHISALNIFRCEF